MTFRNQVFYNYFSTNETLFQKTIGLKALACFFAGERSHFAIEKDEILTGRTQKVRWRSPEFTARDPTGEHTAGGNISLTKPRLEHPL